jgi:disulfide bond formation protein DsbB
MAAMAATSLFPRRDGPAARRMLILAAAGGSAALLAAALAFQFVGGLHPCPLCLWQRWPHLAAPAWNTPIPAVPGRALPLAGALAALATAGIGVFHAGVEQGWWQGLASCTGGSLSGLSPLALIDPSVPVAPPARCDAIPWSFAGLSMAAWNAVLSLALAGLWLAAARGRAARG